MQALLAEFYTSIASAGYDRQDMDQPTTHHCNYTAGGDLGCVENRTSVWAPQYQSYSDVTK